METQNQQTKPLKNIYAWILAFLPLFFGVPPDEYFNYAMVIGGVAVIGLLVADRMALSEAGYEPPAILWGVLFLPVYLWKRATITKGSRIPFIVIVASLACIIFIGIPHREEVALEEAACPLVTTILKENNGTTAPKCMKVTIQDKVTDKFYKATATLDNGNDINVTLELTGDRNFYVRVPDAYLNN